MAQWQPAPDPFPTWVTAVPSLRHPTLVPDFARKVGKCALGLPFHMVLEKTDDRPEQKTMANSSSTGQKYRRLIGIGSRAEFLMDPVLVGRRHGGFKVDNYRSKLACCVSTEVARYGPLALAQTGHETDESESL
jgi:hypothetical protein